MNIGTTILLFYKDRNAFLKILLLPLLILGCLLWVVGSLAHWNTLVMFLVGVIVGCVLFYFFSPCVTEWITNLINR
jgi:hypothetical protein